MPNKCLCLGVMLLVTIAMAGTASAAGTEGARNGAADYTVRPAMDSSFYGLAFNGLQTVVLTSVSGTIGPGERRHFIKNVNEDIECLNVDLRWANPRVGLKLQVYAPDGTLIGVFDDGWDNLPDRRIDIDILSNGGYIQKGQWDYYVVYDRGTEITEFTI